MNVERKIIFITGGTSGIGLELTKLLLNKKAKVIICGRDRQKLSELQAQHSELITIQCDISKTADIQSAIYQIQQDFGRLDILINNAGIQYNYNFVEEKSEIVLEKTTTEMQINFIGVVELTKLALPLLQKPKEALIINITSILAYSPKFNAPIYCPSKAAVHSFTEILRHDLRSTKSKSLK